MSDPVALAIVAGVVTVLNGIVAAVVVWAKVVMDRKLDRVLRALIRIDGVDDRRDEAAHQHAPRISSDRAK
jgi:hypothetical protein